MRLSSGVDTDVHLHVPSIAACSTRANAFTWRAKHPLQRYEPVVRQIKQLSLAAFDILRSRLPAPTPYIKFQRARHSYSNVCVTHTTVLWWLRHHWELLHSSNAGLTPCLKPGGCASTLLTSMHNEMKLMRLIGSTASLRDAVVSTKNDPGQKLPW